MDIIVLINIHKVILRINNKEIGREQDAGSRL